MAPPLVDASAQLRAFLLLAILLGIAGVVLWRRRALSSPGPGRGPPQLTGWLRRLVPGTADTPLRVVQSARLTPRASVHVVSWDEQEWLLACTDQGVTVIGQRKPAAQGRGEPRADAPAGPSLSDAIEASPGNRRVGGER